MALAPGERIGPYEIVAALGAGGMGQVYRARDTRLNRVVGSRLIYRATRKGFRPIAPERSISRIDLVLNWFSELTAP